MKLRIATIVAALCISSFCLAAETTTPTMTTPTAPGFKPLPPPDAAFQKQIEELVVKAQLDEHTPASQNPDNEEEWASICVVDLADINAPRVGGWQQENFVYPASTYKMYVLGEAIRQVCDDKLSLDRTTTISTNNFRGDDGLAAESTATLSEVLHQMCMYSSNTAANVAIDTIDRRNASAMLKSLGCIGSDITRKYLPRSREDAEFKSAPGTVSNALHFATFLYAAETGAIGGGRGRALIKGYLGTNVQNSGRTRAGLPDSASIYSKTGEWDTFTAEAALIEDGKVRYIIVMLTAMPQKKAEPRMAAFVKSVHELLK